ncbi:glycosyltransferase family 2 protein [Longimicrobium sp.]|uniref:glycosyltransferase family 2 protein n=1 Tax=Longimicrobium sp. TaxID=2029185 RepID=UPI002E33BB72|nr:glycosyltransferase [Longimicrobium sp.]HEX6040757.1 glycosyltransferase [Longimicrobium sp.]
MIYICIPALNEAPTVGVLLWRIRQVMTEFRRDFHLIVLDDGSTDATAEVLAPYEKVLPLTLLRNDRTAGYAAALERLLRETVARSTHPKRDIAVVLQADFTEPPEEIPALVRKLEGGADVVGSAVAGVDAELPRGLRWSRRGLPWLLGRKRLPKEGGDPMSGFRAYRVHVIKRALQDREGAPLLTRQGWAANAELLMAVAPHTRRADRADVELRYNRRDRDTRFTPWPTLRETWELVRRAPRLARMVPAAEPAPASAAAAPPQSAPARQDAPRGDSARAESARADGPREGAPREGRGDGPREGRRRNRSERASADRPAADRPATEPSTEERTSAERPARQRPRTERPRVEMRTAETSQGMEPSETADVVDGTEPQPRAKAKRRPRRKRPAASQASDASAESSAEPMGTADGAEAAGADGAEGSAEPRERKRRPSRRNRKRGRREGSPGDPPDQPGSAEPSGPADQPE